MGALQGVPVNLPDQPVDNSHHEPYGSYPASRMAWRKWGRILSCLQCFIRHSRRSLVQVQYGSVITEADGRYTAPVFFALASLTHPSPVCDWITIITDPRSLLDWLTSARFSTDDLWHCGIVAVILRFCFRLFHRLTDSAGQAWPLRGKP